MTSCARRGSDSFELRQDLGADSVNERHVESIGKAQLNANIRQELQPSIETSAFPYRQALVVVLRRKHNSERQPRRDTTYAAHR